MENFLNMTLPGFKRQVAEKFYDLFYYKWGMSGKVPGSVQQNISRNIPLDDINDILIRKMVDPVAIEILCDRLVHYINRQTSLYNDTSIFPKMAALATNPSSSSVVVDKVLDSSIGCYELFSQSLGNFAFRNVTVPMVKKLIKQNPLALNEFVRHQFLYRANLAVIFYLSQATLKGCSPDPDLQKVLVFKLGVDSWGDAANLILSCNGFEVDDFNGMPLAWCESLLGTIENPVLPSVTSSVIENMPAVTTSTPALFVRVPR